MHQGLPWDLMAWGFVHEPLFHNVSSTKSVNQVKQEAAIVLAQGGGFQVYFGQNRDGSVRLGDMAMMQEVAEFCRARQLWCHRAQPVPQIALFYSGSASYRKSKNLFATWDGELKAMQGILQMLVESQNCVDITMEHQLTGRMQEYGLIVIPEWAYIEPKLKLEMVDYVANGGQLMIVGLAAVELFAEELGVKFLGEPAEGTRWLEHNGRLTGLYARFQEVECRKGIKSFGRLFKENDSRGGSQSAGSISTYGKGSIAAVYFEMGERYVDAASVVERLFIQDLVQQLFPNPIVTVSGSSLVEVAISRKNNQTIVHLINTAGPHGDDKIAIFDEIPPIGPLTISIAAAKNPVNIMREPIHIPLDYKYEDGCITIVLNKLDLYEMIVFQLKM